MDAHGWHIIFIVEKRRMKDRRQTAIWPICRHRSDGIGKGS